MNNILRVALPKGRLGEQVYERLDKAGYSCPEILEQSRKLVFENLDKGVRYFWVKPSDVAVYVERGAADLGVVGRDTLLENSPDIYELLDLRLGKCRMSVAAPEAWRDDTSRALRVASKYPRIAARFYEARGRDIDIITLNGSVELAPLLDLSDVIVDIVETGKTLVENGLRVVEDIVPISARLIANRAAYHFKHGEVETMTAALRKGIDA